MRKPVTGFMCMIDWEHELGHAYDGNKVWPSLQALKDHHPMWAECGVVEVQVSFVRETVPEDYSKYRAAGVQNSETPPK